MNEDIKNFLMQKDVLINFIGLFFILNLTLFIKDSIFCLLLGIATLFMTTISFVHMFINNKKTTSNEDNWVIKNLAFQTIIQLIPILVFLFFVFSFVETIPIFQENNIKYILYFLIAYVLLIFFKFNMVFVAENLKISNFYNLKKLACFFNKNKMHNTLTFFIDSIVLSCSCILTNKYASILAWNVYYLITIYFLLTYAFMNKFSNAEK